MRQEQRPTLHPLGGSDRQLHDAVCRVLVNVLDEPCAPERLSPNDSLLELGMDSLKMVDLAVALEQSLGIAEFPLQAWADQEAERDEPRFTIAALVDACGDLLRKPS